MFEGRQKTVVAFVLSLVASAGTAILAALNAVGDGATLGDLDTAAWVSIVLAVVASTGLVTGSVYGVPNRHRADMLDSEE